jgi:glycosyltransferase involved in cell wall biosynthesis
VYKDTGVKKTMSNILIYYPSNKPSNVIETIANGFVDSGHNVFFLSQTPSGEIHQTLSSIGVNAEHCVFPKKIAIVYYIRHLLFLISYCKKNRIIAIQAHLQQANIVAIFAHYFIKARVVVCRHHYIETNKTATLFDKVINYFAKTIVVPAHIIRDKLINEENVNKEKVKLVPYIYNFDKYPVASEENVKQIRNKYPCKLLLLVCGRFVSLKRNEIAITALKKLLAEGYDIKLLMLDEGPELDRAKKYVEANHLTNNIEFLGYRKNNIDYMAACDVLVHPSFTEASNNTVKEAGIYAKTIIVCKNVGDFSEYVVHEQNGYLIDKENPLPDLVETIRHIYAHKNKATGALLKKTVYERFHKSETIINQHLKLLLQ